MIEAGSHLYPYRTQKLSPRSPMVLRGISLGRVGRCRDREKEPLERDFRRRGLLKRSSIREDLLEQDKRQAKGVRERSSVAQW